MAWQKNKFYGNIGISPFVLTSLQEFLDLSTTTTPKGPDWKVAGEHQNMSKQNKVIFKQKIDWACGSNAEVLRMIGMVHQHGYGERGIYDEADEDRPQY